MKKAKQILKFCLEKWFWGKGYMLCDEIISWYAYFTLVFAEIAFLWSFFGDIALPFSCLLGANVLNIIVCSWIKGEYEGRKVEWIVSKVYLVITAVIFVAGFFVCGFANIYAVVANIILFVIPILITFLWTQLFGYIHPIAIWVIPFCVLCAGIGFTELPLWSKILIPIVYAVLVPYIVYFEDSVGSGLDMFEVAFDITWSKEYEKHSRLFYPAEYRDITDEEMKKENEKLMLNSENHVEEND